jgi:hypothetical protein
MTFIGYVSNIPILTGQQKDVQFPFLIIDFLAYLPINTDYITIVFLFRSSLIKALFLSYN